MSIFTRKKEHEVQAFITKLVNNNCVELEALVEGPRLEDRVRLTIVVLVIPVENNRPVLEEAFAAVTKEFSSAGVALVVNEPVAIEHAILGFRFEGAMNFIRATAKHLNPMGAGFYQLGLQLTEKICLGDHPQLQSVIF